MKLIATILFSLLSFSFLAQKETLLFKIGNQYIFADTNGNIPLGKRFDYIHNTILNEGQYIVRSQDKYGVVKNNAYLFPCEYDQIMAIELRTNFHVYVLGRVNKSQYIKSDALERIHMNALATSDGVIHTGFDYKRIDEYSLSRSSENKEINDNGAFFRLQNGDSSQLMYISKSNKSTFLMHEWVAGIKDAYGLFAFRKGDQEALYEFDKTTASLKEIIPFTFQFIVFRSGFYSVWNPVKNVSKKYSYSHQLLESVKGFTKFGDYGQEGVERVEANDGADPVEVIPLSPDLDRERSLLKRGWSEKVIKSFHISDLSIPEELNYRAEITVRGKKGAWLVDARYIPSQLHKQEDTVFRVAVDELIVEDEGVHGIILTRTGKLYGAIDSRGNEIVAPVFKSLQVIRSDYGADWLVAREGNRSVTFCYDAKTKRLYGVFDGEVKDQFEIHYTFIEVKRLVGKKKYQTKLVKWIPSYRENQFTVFDENEFYDSVVRCKSFSYFFQTYRRGKMGILTDNATPLLACIYDSIQLNAYYFLRFHPYLSGPSYEVLQPIFSAYLNGKQQIVYPTKNEYSSEMIHSFTDGSLNASATISDDGLYVIDTVENNRVEIYSIDGKKLTKEPILLDKENKKLASFTGSYWYLRGTDSQNRDVLVGQNGAWFVLPEK
jgi:hypothetical protein